MRKEYRFRTNLFGKLILLVRHEYGNRSFTQWTEWRDAKLEDIDIEMLNLLKGKEL